MDEKTEKKVESAKKAKRTKTGRRLIRKWLKNPTAYIPKEGEYFVDLDKTGKSSHGGKQRDFGFLYISNFGTILDFRSGEVEVFEPKIEKGSGYPVGFNDRIHVIAFFSFYKAAKYRDRFNHDRAAKERIKSIGLSNKTIYASDTEVHHINGVKTDCSISNLQAMPKKMHDFLTSMQRTMPNARHDILFADPKKEQDIDDIFEFIEHGSIDRENSKTIVTFWKKNRFGKLTVFWETPKTSEECQELIRKHVFSDEDMFFAIDTRVYNA